MRLKTPTEKKAKKVSKPKLAEAIERLEDAQTNFDTFVRDNRKLVEKYLDLQMTLENVKESVKPAVRAALLTDEPGKHIIGEWDGWRASVLVTQVIDANALLEAFPKLEKLAKVKRTIDATEGERLVGAGILTKAQLQKHKVPGNKSVFLERL